MKVVLYMAVSIDGYIAREDDSTDWVSDKEWESFKNILKEAGNAIVGRRNYAIIEKEETFPFEELFIVGVSSKEIKPEKENVAWVKSPREALNLLEEKGFQTAVVSGGGKLNSSFLKEGLIDEIFLDVEPIVLGKGVQLFYPSDLEANLELLEVKKISDQEIQLHYKIIK